MPSGFRFVSLTVETLHLGKELSELKDIGGGGKKAGKVETVMLRDLGTFKLIQGNQLAGPVESPHPKLSTRSAC